jgi:hypothetical protein
MHPCPHEPSTGLDKTRSSLLDHHQCHA